VFKNFYREKEIKDKLSEVDKLHPQLYNLLLEKIEFRKYLRFKKTIRQSIRKFLAIGIINYLKEFVGKDITSKINNPSNKKKILFVTGVPSLNLVGISVYLRKTGEYETILIGESPWLTSFFKQYFDYVYTYNSYYDAAFILFTSKPYIVHVQGMPHYYFLGVLAKTLSSAAVICGFIDIPSFEHVNDISKKSKIFQLDYFAEEFIFKNVDGAVFVTEANVSDYFRSRYNTKIPLLEFHPYICDEFIKEEEKYSRKDNKIYLVYGGLVVPSDKPKNQNGVIHFLKLANKLIAHRAAVSPPQSSHIQFLKLANKLIAQGLYFHMYLPPTYSPLIVKKLYPDYIQLSNESQAFAFEQGLPLDKAVSEFSKYDFAMLVSILEGMSVDSLSWENCVPSKFFTYLAAGLPVIVVREYGYIAPLVEKYEIGIVISQNEIDSLVDVIKKYNYERLVLNVKKAREEFSMKNHIGRLIQLYEQAHTDIGKIQ